MSLSSSHARWHLLPMKADSTVFSEELGGVQVIWGYKGAAGAEGMQIIIGLWGRSGWPKPIGQVPGVSERPLDFWEL